MNVCSTPTNPWYVLPADAKIPVCAKLAQVKKVRIKIIFFIFGFLCSYFITDDFSVRGKLGNPFL